MVGQGFLEDFRAVNVIGRSGGVVVAWNKTVFTKVDSKTGKFLVAVKIKRQSDELEVVVISVYGPTNVRRRAELWGELEEMVVAFQGSPILMGGDFNVTLEVEDRPNNAGGQDRELEGL